jgi:hypothetical protein
MSGLIKKKARQETVIKEHFRTFLRKTLQILSKMKCDNNKLSRMGKFSSKLILNQLI